MIRNLFVVALAIALVPSALGQSTADQAEQDVREVQRQFNEARMRADVATLERLLADGWTITHGDGTIDTKAQYLADLASGARKFAYVTEDEVTVRLHGDTAVVSGISDSKVQFSGGSTGGALRFTRVYVRRDGRWLMIVSHATRRQAPGPAAGRLPSSGDPPVAEGCDHLAVLGTAGGPSESLGSASGRVGFGARG